MPKNNKLSEAQQAYGADKDLFVRFLTPLSCLGYTTVVPCIGPPEKTTDKHDVIECPLKPSFSIWSIPPHLGQEFVR